MTRPKWTRLLTDARKLGVALLGVVASAAAAGLLPAPFDRWAPVIVALATAVGVYRVQNTGTVPTALAELDVEDARNSGYTIGRADEAAGRPHAYPPAQRGPSHL